MYLKLDDGISSLVYIRIRVKIKVVEWGGIGWD